MYPTALKHKELNNLLSSTLANYVTNDTLGNYATDNEMQEYVTRRLANISSGGKIDLDGYVTITALNSTIRDIDNALSGKADEVHEHEEYMSREGFLSVMQDYATKEEIPESLPANGGHADTALKAGNSLQINGYYLCVCTKEEYDELVLSNMISSTTLYFVKED